MGRILEIIQSDSLKWLRDQVDEFTATIMCDYLIECEKRCHNISLNCKHTKNFYDSVWGTIEINEGEIFILDSPLLQRLRHIKQLGLADLLYSSANHTRFSHTLGVLQTANVMVEQIEKEMFKKEKVVEDDVRQIVRLAAIFHDCGHMFCSHASERYFQKNYNASLYQKIDDTRFEINQAINIKPSVSELISVLMVNSNSVRKLLELIQNGLEKLQFDNNSQDKIIEKVCCMIWGFPYSQKTIPYSQVISGQIDADKLDYLKRDSHATGVPVAVDMSRIFQKLRIVETNENPRMIANNDGSEKIYKLAIAPAAINTIDQLVISRSMMFENIYYHQKTITSEDMLRYAMLYIDKSSNGFLDDFRGILALTDDMILSKDIEVLLKNNIEKFNITNIENFRKGCAILANIKNRQLFKRCVAFTDKNLTTVVPKENSAGFYARVIAGEVTKEREEFVNNIIQKVKELKEQLKGSGFSFNTETDIRILVTQVVTSEPLNSNIAIDTKSKKDRNMEFESDSWLQSRSSRKSQNYLVSYPEDRYLVYIATELVLLRDYGQLINDAIIYSEEDEEQINKLKKKLDEKGYYQEFNVLAPDETITIHTGEISNLVKKWSGYEFFDYYTGEGAKLDEAYIKMHIKQFIRYKENSSEFHKFVKAYLEMLSKMKIIFKADIVKSLQNNFKAIMKQEKCSVVDLKVCNIGSVQDSSAIIAYHVNILNISLGASWQTQPLEKVLETAEFGQRIVFLEDAFCSGKQILSIFETYMGIPLAERQTQEIHVSELTDQLKQKLRECRLIFSFIYYEKENEEFFNNRMKEIGLKNISIIANDVFPKGYFMEEVGNEEEASRSILKKYLIKAGHELLEYKALDKDGNKKPSWTEERINTSSLGYNNAQQLIAFIWNTPTYTITPLWLGVNKSEFRWIPLFPRIDK